MTDARHAEHRLRRRVQFYEADPAGIVHFSWFFRYMEEAEHALWREAGLSIAPPGAGIAFPRVSASFDYHRPLRFDEEFDIHIRIAAITGKTIRYACAVRRGQTLVATGTMTVACVSHKPEEPMKAVPIPDAIASRFAVAADPEGESA
ncbi:MAG: acyl-CoA thioesterase [Acidobacteria bacterium]|nr:acyl-CoA thioesterase [Acidobacteriota bacterium]